MKHPTILVILDGLGYSKEKKYNAVAQAETPTLDYLKQNYPHKLISASGEAVGLLPNVMGNSEVGHVTIGAGRIVEQPIKRINKLIDNKKLSENLAIKTNFSELAKTEKTLHLIGLLSNGGIHSHIKHLYALIDIARQFNIKHISIHPILDGRDAPPKSAKIFLTQIEQKIHTFPEAYIASICGRFYAMDRNQEWNRTQKAYDMLTKQNQIKFNNWQQAIDYYYRENITDEFIPPTQLSNKAIVNNNDGILFFNYRPDRARQLTQAFIDPTFDKFHIQKLKLAFFITPTIYDAHFPTQTILEKQEINNTLKEVLSENNLSTFAIAETEKYAHVTYFFNARNEKKYKNETQVLIPSISTETYKDFPEMQANEITKQLVASLQTNPKDFYLVNYANPDMVGHSGNFDATKKAVECVDEQISKLYDQVIKKMNGTLYITADHGNAEIMWDEKNNQPHTSHSTNPVEFIFVNNKVKNKKINLPLTGLKDIAPFILENLEVPIPKEMSSS